MDKSIFAAIPSQYRLNDEEADTLRARINALVRKAEAGLGVECYLIADIASYFTDKNFREKGYNNSHEAMSAFLEDAINLICEADFSVFPFGWETSRECRILHKVSNECGIVSLAFKEDLLP